MFIVHQMMIGKGLKKCEFLKPFYVMTNLISSSSYPKSNCYFIQVWKIESLLCEYVVSDDPMIKEMNLKMFAKFTKYWHEYFEILSIGDILDPQLKFKVIRFAYTKIDHSTCEEKITDLRKNIENLFDEYVKAKSSESNSNASTS